MCSTIWAMVSNIYSNVWANSVRTKSRSHLTAIVATCGNPYFTAFVGTDDGGRHLTAIVETGGGLHLDQHGGHQGVGLLFAHQNLHNLQRKLKACAGAPTCDQLSILNNAIFWVCVASWKRKDNSTAICVSWQSGQNTVKVRYKYYNKVSDIARQIFGHSQIPLLCHTQKKSDPIM